MQSGQRVSCTGERSTWEQYRDSFCVLSTLFPLVTLLTRFRQCPQVFAWRMPATISPGKCDVKIAVFCSYFPMPVEHMRRAVFQHRPISVFFKKTDRPDCTCVETHEQRRAGMPFRMAQEPPANSVSPTERPHGNMGNNGCRGVFLDTNYSQHDTVSLICPDSHAGRQCRPEVVLRPSCRRSRFDAKRFGRIGDNRMNFGTVGRVAAANMHRTACQVLRGWVLQVPHPMEPARQASPRRIRQAVWCRLIRIHAFLQ